MQSRMNVLMIAATLVVASTGCSAIRRAQLRQRATPMPAPQPLTQSQTDAPGQTPPPKVVRPTDQPPAQTTDTATVEDSGDADRADVPDQSPVRDEPPAIEPAFYQLVLSDSGDTSAANFAGMARVRVPERQARSVGTWIARLILPTGPSGTVHSYTLIYPTEIEVKAASQLAELIAAPSQDAASDSDTDQPFNAAVGLLYGSKPGDADRTEHLKRAQDLFKRVVTAQSAPVMKRWAAAMLAGKIAGELLGDYNGALEYYEHAAAVAAERSLLQAEAQLATAMIHLQAGRSKEARELLAGILAAFESAETEVAKRANELWVTEDGK